MTVIKRAAIAAALALSTLALGAQTFTIRMVNVAPESSPWYKGLKTLADALPGITGGEVKMRIETDTRYSEIELVKKLSIGRYDAATLTPIGMGEIFKDVFSFSVPSLIRTDEELDYVLDKAKGAFAPAFDARGYRLLSWIKLGWLRFFTKSEASTPEDVMRLKLAASPEQLQLADAFKTLGYSTVSVTYADLMPALSSGMVEAIYSSPMITALNQWFGIAKHMVDYKICPFVGGIVISKRAWDRIPEKYKPQILELLAKIEKQVNSEVGKLEASAIDAMRKAGKDSLTIVPVDAALRKRWDDSFEAKIPSLLGSIFGKDAVETIKAMLKAYRGK